MPFFVLQLVVTCLTQYMSQFKYCVIRIERLPIVHCVEGVWVIGQQDSVLYEHGCIAPGVAGRCCLSQGTFVGKGKQSVCTTSFVTLKALFAVASAVHRARLGLLNQ